MCSFSSKVEFLQVRIALDEDLGLNGEDFFHVGADHAGESHLADLLQLVWKRNGEKKHKERRKSGQTIVIISYHHHERELVARIGMRPPLRQQCLGGAYLHASRSHHRRSRRRRSEKEMDQSHGRSVAPPPPPPPLGHAGGGGRKRKVVEP